MIAARFHRLAGLALAGMLAVGAGCTSASSDAVTPQGNSVLPFHATLPSNVLVPVIVITVTGAGINVPIVNNIPVSGGSANGNISVPIGPSRTILAEAFDTNTSVLYSGSVVVNVTAGTNPTVSFALGAGVGTVPITAVVGNVTLTLSPPTASVRAGNSVTLTGVVRDAFGVVIPGAPVNYATTLPPKAWVQPSGVVTALDSGTVVISATSLGSVSNSTITVTPGTALDFVTIAPSTMSTAAGATLTTDVTLRDAGPGGVDSVQVQLQPASGAPQSCTATAPFTGARAQGVFRCNVVLGSGAVVTGAMTVGQVTVWWNGPTGGSTVFSPTLLNARGVTATVTVTP
jgi:hypothetical protein